LSEFIHLHNHSHYSLLDAISTIDGLIQAAKDNNMPAVALTDHGVMFGVMEFYNKAKAIGIKPIIGCEVYMITKGSRFEKGKDASREDTMLGNDKSIGKLSKRKSNYDHLVLLCKNETGYRNLLKLVSCGHTEGFYYKPRIDVELLKENKEGLVALSACAGGVVASHILKDDINEAKESARIYKEIFGDDFYLEIQNHGMAIERKVLERMPKIAKELGIKLIATNDVHYIKHEDHIPHNIYLYINTDLSKDKEQINPETDLRYETDQVYFKSAEQMCELFKDFPEAIASTLEVADKCNLELPRGEYYMPDFPLPENSNAKNLDEYFETLALEGLHEKIKNVTQTELDRLKLELDVITKMKFSGYFLIVADFVKHAKQSGILVGPGRGSSAGSLVCYALGITNVNPLDYNLLFERFLNAERVSMPDIDIDFQDDKRDEVINYSKQKYGEKSVSQIVTFNKLKTKAVLKDVGRVLNYPFDTMNEITKHVPSLFGKVKSLSDCYKDIPEFKNYFDEIPERKKLLNYSIVLENLNKNSSVHASGVVIAPGDISYYSPIAKTPGVDNQYMTQYDMKTLEDAGLIKMDFLGLKELKILQQATDLVEKRRGIKIDLDSLPLDDTKTFELFSTGQTIGIFQFSKPKMREYLSKMKPKNINDLAAMNALYRPGPMDLIPDFIDKKSGKKEITYLHEDIKSILEETYGIIVYQEQVMQLVRKIAGYSLAKADIVRRAMGKKDEKLMKEQEKEFIQGAIENGYEKKLAKDIFRLILKFADYGFNKSHSVAYSILAFHTAYMKTHYILEFITSLLNCRKDETDDMVLLINDCKRMGIKISTPEINSCYSDFTINDNADNEILFGLSSIKNVGWTAVENIVSEREKNGVFKTFVDFCSRVDPRIVNKKPIESLIHAGAFDKLEPNRKKLADHFEVLITKYSVKKAKDADQNSLFTESRSGFAQKDSYLDSLKNYSDWNDKEKLSLEKKVLGYYVSAHPLADYEDTINHLATLKFGDVESEEEREKILTKTTVRMCGIINSFTLKLSKKGNRYCTFTLEDFTGHGECIMFTQGYEKYKDILQNDLIVSVYAKPQEGGNGLKLLVDEISILNKMDIPKQKDVESITIKIKTEKFNPELMQKFKKVLSNGDNSPKTKIFFDIYKNNSEHEILLLEDYKLSYDDSSREELERIFGNDNISVN